MIDAAATAADRRSPAHHGALGDAQIRNGKAVHQDEIWQRRERLHRLSHRQERRAVHVEPVDGFWANRAERPTRWPWPRSGERAVRGLWESVAWSLGYPRSAAEDQVQRRPPRPDRLDNPVLLRRHLRHAKTQVAERRSRAYVTLSVEARCTPGQARRGAGAPEGEPPCHGASSRSTASRGAPLLTARPPRCRSPVSEGERLARHLARTTPFVP